MIDQPEGEVTQLERELLRAGRQQRLSAGERERIWAGVGAALVAPAVSAATAAPAVKAGVAGAAKTLGAGAIVKGSVLAAVLGGGALAGYQLMGARADGVPPVAATATVSPPAAAPPPRPAPEEATAKAVAPAPRAPRAEAPRPAPSRLAAEGHIVLEARRALRDGDAEAALRRLEGARRAFADGALVQEREALTIEALHRAGQREAAAARARAFLRAYPGSPHAASVRAFAAP
jgi:hypothetical protein